MLVYACISSVRCLVFKPFFAALPNPAHPGMYKKFLTGGEARHLANGGCGALMPPRCILL